MLKARQSTYGLVLAGLLMGGACLADSAIPNMVGTWVVESEGGVLAKASGPREDIHHRGEFSKFKGEMEVVKQEGHIVHGVFSSPRAKEKFIGAITMDNKGFVYADEDGFLEGVFVDNDKLNHVYRHVTPTDTVIGVGTMTRKK